MLCVLIVDGVCCSECDVVSNECNEPTSCLVQPIGAHCCEVMYFWCFGFRGELGSLNCDDVCMCVVNKQFELLEFVSECEGARVTAVLVRVRVRCGCGECVYEWYTWFRCFV